MKRHIHQGVHTMRKIRWACVFSAIGNECSIYMEERKGGYEVGETRLKAEKDKREKNEKVREVGGR